MEGRLLLDVVIAESATILKLLSSEDQALLIGGNTFLILDLSLDVLNSVGSVNVKGNRLAGKGLDEDLHGSAPESEDKVKSGLLLDVIVAEGPAVFQLLASKDQSLLIGRDALLVLNLGFHILNGVSRLYVESDSLAREGLNENLHCHDCLVNYYLV